MDLKHEKGVGEIAIMNNGGYIKHAVTEFIGLLMTHGATFNENKFLSLSLSLFISPLVPGYGDILNSINSKAARKPIPML